MEYEFLTQEEQDDIVAEAMKSRELEHFHYAHNAAVYAAMLETLPKDDWPAGLAHLKGQKRDDIVRQAGAESATALQYLQRDQLAHLKKTEEAEQANIDRIHAGLASRFGGDTQRRAAAVGRVKAKAAAAVEKAQERV